MPIYVPGIGNPNAKILILGEAPGENEEKELEPFVGPSGNLLNEILRYANIDRRECYITNVCKVRPPHNDIKQLKLIGHTIEDFLPQLDDEIRSINPNIIFGLGNIPLEYITGNKGIMNYRGSILHSIRTGHKFVGSIHPAAILHGESGSSGSYKDLFLMKMDAVRVLSQSSFPEIVRPDRHITLLRSSMQLVDFLERNKSNPENEIIKSSKFPLKRRLVVDVETYKTYPICIGLAFNSYDAISIPMFDENFPLTDLNYIWELIAELFANENTQIIAQNITFDNRICRNVGLHWREMYADTMMMWHCLFSELRKDLGTLVSILTEEPYYKSEGREYNPKKDSFDVLMKYNAKDAYCTYEAYERLHEMLIEENMEEFFFQTMKLNGLYERIEDFGFLVDETQRKLLKDKFTEKLKEKKEKLANTLELLVGERIILNPNSPKQVAEMLYGQLKIPLRKDTGEDTLKALVNNTVKDPLKKNIVNLILECRKIQKSIGTYIEYGVS